MVPFEARVEFQYQAEEPDELSLQVGQILLVVQDGEEGWWRGILDGTEGMFPSNFVKKLDPPKPVKPERPSKPAKLPKTVKKCKALYEYTPVADDELLLAINDVITFLAEEGEGWWKGELAGKVGLFPNNFVSELYEEEIGEEGSLKDLHSKETPPKEEIPEDSPKEDDNTPGSKLKKIGVPTGGIGSLFAGGIPKLSKKPQSTALSENILTATPAPEAASAQVMKKETSKASLTKSAADLSPAPPKPAPVSLPEFEPVKIKKAKALHTYETTDADEISLTQGDILTILEEGEDGWWKGTNPQGKTGLFPSNFVETFFEAQELKSPRSAPPAKPPAITKPQLTVKPPKSDSEPNPAPLSPPSQSTTSSLVFNPPIAVAPIRPTTQFAKPPRPSPAASTGPVGESAAPALPEPSSVFEKKKFVAPPTAAPKPAAAPDNELLKKLSVRNLINEGELPAPSLKADPAIKSEALPPRPEIPTSKPEIPYLKAEIPISKPEIPTSKPDIPYLKAEIPTSKPEGLPSRPEISAALALSSKPAKEPQSLEELKDWFLGEMIVLKKEIVSEKAEREALLRRIAKLEGSI